MRKFLLPFVILLAPTALLHAQAAPPAAPQAGSQTIAPEAPPAPAPPRAQAPPAYNCEPVNPNATPEARALLKTICAVSGKGTLSGQHNFPNHRDLDTERSTP